MVVERGMPTSQGHPVKVICPDAVDAAGPSSNPAPPSAFSLRDQLADTGKAVEASVHEWVSAQADLARAKVRRVAVWGAIGAVALIAGLTFVVVTTTLLITGIARGLSLLFGGRIWLGNLVTALLLMGLAALAAYVVWRRANRKRLDKLAEKYEELERKSSAALHRQAQGNGKAGD